MNQLPVIVYEQSNYWAAGLRRWSALISCRGSRPGASGEAIELYETRMLGDALSAIGPKYAGLLVVELTAANAARVLDAVGRLYLEYPEMKTVVVARHELSAWEEPARAAGALYFATSIRQLEPVVTIAQQADAGCDESLSWREQVRRRLPWGKSRL